MLARVVKELFNQTIRKAMEKLQMPSDEPYRRIAISFLNLIFGQTEQSTKYWATEISSLLGSKFGVTRISVPDDLKLSVDPSVLFSRTIVKLPVLFTQQSKKALSSPSSFQVENPLRDTDIISLHSKIKHMNIIEKGEAFLNYSLAQDSRKTVAQNLLENACAKFEQLARDSPDALTLYYWGKALNMIGSLMEDFPKSVPLFDAACEQFERVFRKNPSFLNIGRDWKEALDKMVNRTKDIQSTQLWIERFYK